MDAPDPRAPVPSRWPERLAGASVRFRYPIVLGALLVTLACAFPAFDLISLRIRTNLFALLPRDHPSVERLLALIGKTGGWGDLMVVIESADRAANRSFAARLQASLAGVP